MNCLSVLEDHRTVRDFLPDPVPEEDLRRMLHLAQRASTDATAQLYSFVRITDRKLRQRIADLAGGQRHVLEAPEFLVVCADVHRLSRLLDFRGVEMAQMPRMAFLFGAIDASLAAQNLAIAAETMGYGIAFIGGIQNDPEELVELLRLPRGVYPLVGLCIGRPARRPDRRPRIPLEAVLHENTYQDYPDEALEAMFNAMASVSATGDWLSILRRYFGRGGRMASREGVVGRALARQGFG